MRPGRRGVPAGGTMNPMQIPETAVRHLATLLSPAGARAKLLILMYHRVLPAPDPLVPDALDARTFDAHLRVLKERFNVLPLSEAARRLKAGALPARAACITFDDGYRDNVEVALPILKRWGLTATFFIAVGFLGRGRMWNDGVIEAVRAAGTGELDLAPIGLGRFSLATDTERLQCISSLIGALKYLALPERLAKVEEIAAHVGEPLPEDLMMSPEQVRLLHAERMSVGAHTVNHPILARIPDGQANREILEGRDYLQSLLREPVPLFAYPNGKPGRDYDGRHVEMARRAGFEAAVSAAWGFNTQASDGFQLARIAPWERTPLRFALRMLKSYF